MIIFMPVDRKLALETLKEFDDELYSVCARLQEIGEYLASNPDLFKRFSHSTFASSIFHITYLVYSAPLFAHCLDQPF